MTIYDKTIDEKILFPVGIGILQTETVRNFYNTSDATATPNDILVGKTSYGKYGMINGTLDLEGEKNTSYQEGYLDGENEGFSDGYAEGLDDGKIEGREEIIEEQSDANITPGSVLEGYIGYGPNNERIVGTNVGGFDFTSIGYSSELNNQINRDLKAPLDYTISLMPVDSSTTMINRFFNDTSLYYAPYIDTSITTDMSNMFEKCTNLSVVPEYDYSNVKNVERMYAYSGIKEIDFSFPNNIEWFENIAVYSPRVEKIIINAQNVKYKPSFISSGYAGLGLGDVAYDCLALKYLKIFNIPKFAARNSIWRNCTSLEYIELSGDTSEFQPLTSYSDFSFRNCSNLHTVIFDIDTHFLTTCENMFRSCTSLMNIPYFNTSNVTSMYGMFQYCVALSIPQYDTTNVTNFYNMFRYSKIVTVPLLEAGNVTNVGNMFGGVNTVKNLGGFKDLGKSFKGSSRINHGINISEANVPLTRESCLNLFNSVYDMNLTSVTDANFTLASNVKALLSDEDIAIATNKGWTVS